MWVQAWIKPCNGYYYIYVKGNDMGVKPSEVSLSNASFDSDFYLLGSDFYLEFLIEHRGRRSEHKKRKTWAGVFSDINRKDLAEFHHGYKLLTKEEINLLSKGLVRKEDLRRLMDSVSDIPFNQYYE